MTLGSAIADRSNPTAGAAPAGSVSPATGTDEVDERHHTRMCPGASRRSPDRLSEARGLLSTARIRFRRWPEPVPIGEPRGRRLARTEDRSRDDGSGTAGLPRHGRPDRTDRPHPGLTRPAG